jgi:hypothetical protein
MWKKSQNGSYYAQQDKNRVSFGIWEDEKWIVEISMNYIHILAKGERTRVQEIGNNQQAEKKQSPASPKRLDEDHPKNSAIERYLI